MDPSHPLVGGPQTNEENLVLFHRAVIIVHLDKLQSLGVLDLPSSVRVLGTLDDTIANSVMSARNNKVWNVPNAAVQGNPRGYFPSLTSLNPLAEYYAPPQSCLQDFFERAAKLNIRVSNEEVTEAPKDRKATPKPLRGTPEPTHKENPDAYIPEDEDLIDLL